MNKYQDFKILEKKTIELEEREETSPKLVNFLVANKPLFNESGEVLACYDIDSKELDIVIDEEASKRIPIINLINCILYKLKNEEFSPEAKTQNLIYKGIIKPSSC